MKYQIKKEVEIVKKEVIFEEVTLEQYVGHQIQKAREAKGLNRAAFVESINEEISTTHLKNIEEGLLTMRLRDMILLSNAFGLHISELFPKMEAETTL